MSGLLDDATDAARRALDTGRSAIRKEAAIGAREAVMPWVMLSLALSLYALSSRRRRR